MRKEEGGRGSMKKSEFAIIREVNFLNFEDDKYKEGAANRIIQKTKGSLLFLSVDLLRYCSDLTNCAS